MGKIADEKVELVLSVFREKVREYDHDFRRSDKPSGFWKEKYGTNLHSTGLGEAWAMRAALAAASALTAGERESVEGCEYCVDGLQADGETPCSCQDANEIKAAVLAERESCAFAVECHSGFGDQETIDACAQIVRDRSDPSLRSDSIHLPPERYTELAAAEARLAEALKALEDAREFLRVERMEDGRIGGISHDSDALPKIVAILDEAARRVLEGGKVDG